MKIKLLKLMNDYKFYVLSFWLTAILGMLSFVLTLIFAFLGNVRKYQVNVSISIRLNTFTAPCLHSLPISASTCFVAHQRRIIFFDTGRATLQDFQPAWLRQGSYSFTKQEPQMRGLFRRYPLVGFLKPTSNDRTPLDRSQHCAHYPVI